MKKKKPKKSPSKSSPKSSPKAPSEAISPPVSPDLVSTDTKEISDAQIDYPVDEVAQSPSSPVNPVSDLSDLSATLVVIDAPSSDPPVTTTVIPTDVSKLSIDGTSQSSLDSGKVELVVIEAADPPENLAADAKLGSSSSQLASSPTVAEQAGVPSAPETLQDSSVDAKGATNPISAQDRRETE
ncbi:Uncharacterized protein Rs2_12990 [Raphanus sativus]|nr:Uncharacterized protein Rs2_12990 [Raphanus sativus]